LRVRKKTGLGHKYGVGGEIRNNMKLLLKVKSLGKEAEVHR
jgi:hypothetical protein